MGRLESNGIRTAKNVSKILANPKGRGKPIERKMTIEDEIKQLGIGVLERLKDGTSIDKSNHIIKVVRHQDEDGKFKVFFHVSNMNYGEDHPTEQDCYGTIDEQGRVEVYVSRKPVDFVRPGDKTEEAFSRYSPEERERVGRLKEAIQEELNALEEENEDIRKKSGLGKIAYRISGQKQSLQAHLKDLLSRLPEKFKEIPKKEASFMESIIVNPDEKNPDTKSEPPTEPKHKGTKYMDTK